MSIPKRAVSSVTLVLRVHNEVLGTAEKQKEHAAGNVCRLVWKPIIYRTVIYRRLHS